MIGGEEEESGVNRVVCRVVFRVSCKGLSCRVSCEGLSSVVSCRVVSSLVPDRKVAIGSNSLSSKPIYSLLITIVHGCGWDLSTFLECSMPRHRPKNKK